MESIFIPLQLLFLIDSTISVPIFAVKGPDRFILIGEQSMVLHDIFSERSGQAHDDFANTVKSTD